MTFSFTPDLKSFRMGISHSDFLNMEARLAKNRKGSPEPARVSRAESQEMALHDKIIEYCCSQWPRWKYIRARPDKPSGIEPGAQDFTIFLPGGKTLCVECKSATGKRSHDQVVWAAEMERLGHKVHLVRSMEEFNDLLK